MYLCPLEDKGLVVLPTHRVLKKTGHVSISKILHKARKYFNIKSIDSNKAMVSYLNAYKKQHCIGIVSGHERYLLTLKNMGIVNQLMKGESLAYKQLDVTMLHVLLLKGIDPHHIIYVKGTDEAFSCASSGTHIACILNAVSTYDILKVSNAGETMPQKTTYFYPKLATGLVMHSLKGDSI